MTGQHLVRRLKRRGWKWISPFLAFITEFRRRAGRSDFARGEGNLALLSSWDERTRLLAKLISPECRVLEFGAGRRELRHCLPFGCVYIPSDLVSRSSDRVVLDLNARPLPELEEVDVVVS